MKAFPIDVNTASIEKWQGMDLRDYFAAKVMTKFTFRSPRGSSKTDSEWMLIDATECYEIADAMMKAREQK